MTNIRTAMNRGAFDFLTKPIDFTDFETTVRKTIAHVADLRDARVSVRRKPSARMRRYRAISRPTLRAASLPRRTRSRLAGSDARLRLCSPTSPDSRRWSNRSIPKQLASLLSDYLEGMTEIVFAHEGTVAKIIGDAIHVLFSAPADQPDAASRAIACALALDTRAEQFRQRWKERGAPLGVTRIGVHAGPAIVGNFGGGRLFDYTAYGDTINAAARLEAVNKQLGTRICVSAAAAERAPGFHRPSGRRSHAAGPQRADARLRAAVAGRAHQSPYLSLHAAFVKLEAHDPAALPAFAALVGERPADALAQYHLRRLLNGGRGTRIEMA